MKLKCEKECVRSKEKPGTTIISWACKTLNISRSGFYEYLRRKPSKRMLKNKVLSAEIRKIFEDHKGRHGSVRISKALAQRVSL